MKRASEAPWVRKIGNPSNRENLVMTSPQERPSSVQTLGQGEGHLDINLYFFPRGHGNEFRNLIGSLRGSDFPISAHGHGNVCESFCPFVYKVFLEKKKIDSRE